MKKLLFILLLLPAVYAVYFVFIVQDANDPIKYIYTFTGVTSIILLFATTTIRLVKSKINLMKYRKMVGLFGFFYALLHMINFLVLDMGLDIGFAISETIDKPFIYLGMIAFFALLFMTITSTKKLFKRFNKFHRVLYPVLALSTIHFVMAQKSLSIPQWGYLAVIFIILGFKAKEFVKKA